MPLGHQDSMLQGFGTTTILEERPSILGQYHQVRNIVLGARLPRSAPPPASPVPQKPKRLRRRNSESAVRPAPGGEHRAIGKAQIVGRAHVKASRHIDLCALREGDPVAVDEEEAGVSAVASTASKPLIVVAVVPDTRLITF